VAAEASSAVQSPQAPRRPARAENVGSLLRPPELLNALEAFYEPGHTAQLGEEREKDHTALRSLEDGAIADAVSRQIECGLDVVTDGEFRRLVFFNVFFDSAGGYVPNTGSEGGLQFRGDDGSTVEWPGTPVAAERLRKVDSPVAREVEYLKAITDYPFKVTFPCGSFFLLPMGWKPGTSDKVYRDREEMIEDAIAINRELVADAIAAGAGYVQFDYPLYPHLVDPNWAGPLEQVTGMSLETLVDKAIELDKKVLEGIPDDVTTGIHFCRGNYRSRWLAQGSLEPLAERAFTELPYDVFLVEWDDVKRQGDYRPIRFLRKDSIMVMGVVCSKKRELESEDEILRRLEEAGTYLDMEQLAVSCQCGFASGLYPAGGGRGNEIGEDVQWRKLELVARVAERVWPHA
jgi:methionine synthase II (cobalamin-independent)